MPTTSATRRLTGGSLPCLRATSSRIRRSWKKPSCAEQGARRTCAGPCRGRRCAAGSEVAAGEGCAFHSRRSRAAPQFRARPTSIAASLASTGAVEGGDVVATLQAALEGGRTDPARPPGDATRPGRGRCTGVTGSAKGVPGARRPGRDRGRRPERARTAHAATSRPSPAFCCSATRAQPRRWFARGFGRWCRPLPCAVSGHLQHRGALHNPLLWPYPWLDDIATAAILVKEDGTRFVDEGRGGVFCANAVAALPNPLGAFAIFDQTVWDDAGKARFLPPNPHLKKAGGTLDRADSLPALAQLVKVPGDVLERTIAEYNAALQAGRLDGLLPPRTSRPSLGPLAHAPYYAVPVWPASPSNGASRLTSGRAMHPGGRPFEGLRGGSSAEWRPGAGAMRPAAGAGWRACWSYARGRARWRFRLWRRTAIRSDRAAGHVPARAGSHPAPAHRKPACAITAAVVRVACRTHPRRDQELGAVSGDKRAGSATSCCARASTAFHGIRRPPTIQPVAIIEGLLAIMEHFITRWDPGERTIRLARQVIAAAHCQSILRSRNFARAEAK